MKDSSEEPKSAYEKRVHWYNTLVASVNRYIAKAGSSEDKEKGINDLLTKAIENLEKTVDSNYSVDKDPETKKRLAEISQEIARGGGINLRMGKGEWRRAFFKLFSDTESISDFFDNRHKAIIAKQESMDISYRTEPEKPKAQPTAETSATSNISGASSRKAPTTSTVKSSAIVVDASPSKAPSTSAVKSSATSPVSSRGESASVVDAEKERTSSKTEKSRRKAEAPTKKILVTSSGVMTDKAWDKAVANESRRVADLGKAVLSASSKPGTSDAFKKKQAMLVKGLYDNTNVNAAVKVDRRRERKLGSKEEVREDKARREREERSSAAIINSGAATTTGVHPSRTPTVYKPGTFKGK